MGLAWIPAGDRKYCRRDRAAEGKAMAGSPDRKRKISLTQVTQWGLQLLLVLAVAAALWK